MIIRIIVYCFLAGLALYVFSHKETGNDPLTEENYREKGFIKVKDRYIKYDVYENGEVKTIADMLAKGCEGDDLCEIENSFRYVMNLPYKDSQTNRVPSDVINQNGGDCDEKSFLFASLLIQRGHECVLVITHEHAFVAVHIEKDKKLTKPFAYLRINGKNFYYAETTAKGSYVGWFNEMGPSLFEEVYDINQKKEIPMNQIGFYKG